MPALPGEHHCENHQSNTSHYAKHNCVQCRLLDFADRIQFLHADDGLSPALRAVGISEALAKLRRKEIIK